MPRYRMNVFTGLPDRVNDWSEIWEAISFPPVLTYTDSAVSGAPKLVRFAWMGNWYYVKAYPTIAAEAGGSGDDAADDLYLINDAGLSGAPTVFSLLSNGYAEYYWKAYPVVSAATYHAGAITRWPQRYPDSGISGTPRVAKATVGGTAYYWKVYPTKA